MRHFIFGAFAFLGFMTFCGHADGGTSLIPTLSPKEFSTAVEKDTNAVVIDARRPEEYSEGHLKGAVLMNVLEVSSFEKEVSNLPLDKNYYVYCRSGRRSLDACSIMRRHGLNVFNMTGGILEWEKDGLPVVK